MSRNETKVHLSRAKALVRNIGRDFARSVSEVQRLLDATTVDLDQTSPIRRGGLPKDGEAETSRADNSDKSQAEPKFGPKVGDRMPDGTTYAGVSPDSGNAMYATHGDGLLTYTFNQAQKYAAKLTAHGHKDWRLPTRGELNVLYNNRAAIGRFDESGSYPAGWYWSSSQDNTSAWGQRFSAGDQLFNFKNFYASVRCVR